MDTNKKKVICLGGDSSKVYEQVIFIMKNDLGSVEPAGFDFVKEAERIINHNFGSDPVIMQNKAVGAYTQYKNGIKQLVIKKSNPLDTAMNILMMIGCALLAVVLFCMNM